MKLYKKRINWAVLLLAALAACTPKSKEVEELPYYKDASYTPYWLEPNSQLLATFHSIPSFQLTNQQGETVSNQTTKGKVYIADFFFTTCPGICPKMTANMAQLQDTFLNNPNVLLLSHSVTPETDSVPVLKKYAEMRGVTSPNWHLLTGPRNEIYNLGRHAYFVEEDLGLTQTPDDFLHTENFVLIDQNGHIRGIYNGLNWASLTQLIADVRRLMTP